MDELRQFDTIADTQRASSAPDEWNEVTCRNSSGILATATSATLHVEKIARGRS